MKASIKQNQIDYSGRTMNTNQTPSDSMLRFLYGEMPERESSDFLSFLNGNPSSMQEFIELQETVESIQSIVYAPSEKIISRVHSYASFDIITPQ